MIPIWKDTYYTSTADTLEYYITDGSNTIFRGKSYKAPNANIFITLNEICSHHLNSELPNNVWSFTNNQNVTMSNEYKTFNLYNASNDALLDSFTFYNDWSYEDLDTTILSKPINGKYVNGMFFFYTRIQRGTTITTTAGKTRTSGYNTAVCGDWVLYYSNIYGGWDSFVLEGKVVEGKNIESFNYSKVINNNTINRENVRYQTNIKQNWIVNSGYLSDAESKIIFDNLLTSNNVYLHNLKEDKIYPVHITDTQATYKEFLNERKLINYTINLESDNLLIRK